VVFVLAGVLLTRVPVWRPVDVTTVGGVAIFLAPAQVLLGVLALGGSRWIRDGGRLAVVPVAALLTLAYTGAATISWLLLERGLLA
jgi:hypothetical protein